MAKKIVRVPLAGNAYLETPNAGGRVSRGGISEWSNPDAKFGIYVRFKSSVTFDAAIRLRNQTGKSKIRFAALNNDYEINLEPGYKEIMLGTYTTKGEGYVRFELQGIEREGDYYASPTELIFYGIDKEDISSYISPEEKENFYWTRRGPSVHCGYDIKEHGNVEWFYNEVIVPVGYDPIGTYAMAIGFRGGYFGIQTNSESERRILFSIWSPHVTDDPSTIPEDLRVVCLDKNERTHVGEFGGEGSGGQSYMKYNWKTGQTYRFLMHVKPHGNNKTEFSAYFYFPESERFELIASFLRPMTDMYIEGVHSFLENFSDVRGYITRMVYYGNQWAYTTEGEWFAPEKIRLTGDNTARSKWRLDYDGGLTEDGLFYLKNGGFFDKHEQLDTIFNRDVTRWKKPDFDPNEIVKS